MANILKVSALLQGIWEGYGTFRNAKVRIPEFSSTLTGKQALSVSFTGTGSHTIHNDAGDIYGDAGTITYKDPFNRFGHTMASSGGGSGAMLGFAIHVERAAAATAPTGVVRFTNTGWGGWSSSSYISLEENAYMLFHNPDGPESADASTFTINLANGTGYRVNFIVYYTPS
jgi:hypothetical protein